mmetsp:Transcript_11735/g.21085  ORF Transcript_11735/g.21085 Transcript_11735/m.21085 type:complete len:450 (-) Transcript_11735:390-1739(-)
MLLSSSLQSSTRLFPKGDDSVVKCSYKSSFSRNLLKRSLVHVKAKKSLRDLSKIDLEGKRVFVRADLNVPLNIETNVITDDTRIRAAIPTLKFLIDNGAKIILSSHMGRPKAAPEAKYSLSTIVTRLSELVEKQVKKVNDCIGPDVDAAVKEMQNGDVLLLENVRFHTGEENNDPEFAKQLASNADLFVNDAFGTARHSHASTEGVGRYLKPSVAGLLLEQELAYLDGVVSNPTHPFVAIIGGADISSKAAVLEKLLHKVDKIILGGGMVFSFFKARGLKVGSAVVPDDQVILARRIEEAAKSKGVELILPVDVIVADKFDAKAQARVSSVEAVPEGWMGLDIGPKSVMLFETAVNGAKTVLWNGPMGVFEFNRFSVGTVAMAHTLADLGGGVEDGQGVVTIVGGVESVAAVTKAKVADCMSHVSTGGRAALELLEGKVLPGVAVLDEK